MEKLFALLKKDDLTRSQLDLNFPQAKAFEADKLIKVTGTVHNGGRGRPSNTFSLTAKGRKAVEEYKAEHKGGRTRSASKVSAPAKRGRPKATASKTQAKAKAKPKVATKARKSTGSKPKVKVRARA